MMSSFVGLNSISVIVVIVTTVKLLIFHIVVMQEPDWAMISYTHEPKKAPSWTEEVFLLIDLKANWDAKFNPV